MIRKEAGKLLPVSIDFFKATSGSFPQGTWLEGSAGFLELLLYPVGLADS